jgi:hypothetical protein
VSYSACALFSPLDQPLATTNKGTHFVQQCIGRGNERPRNYVNTALSPAHKQRQNYVPYMYPSLFPLLRAVFGSCSFLALGLLVHGQGTTGSLTEQFPNMSAKERSRIAAKEVEESGKDGAYQAFMLQAEKDFQAGHYQEAIDGYEKARALRPFNVYPKVKIEDLKALLAQRAAPAPVATMPGPEQAIVPTARSVDPVPQKSMGTTPISAPLAPLPVAKEPQPITAPSPAAVEPTRLEPADDLIERRYKEGNAFVIERVVTVDGILLTYKRVFHNWGQVFYFENGAAVDERVWNARFPH